MIISPWLPVSFSSATEVVLFGIAFIAWGGSEIIGSYNKFPSPPSPGRDKTGEEGPAFRAGSEYRYNCINLHCFWFFLVRIAVLPDWVFYPGIALMFGGILPQAVVHCDTRRVLLRAGKYPGRTDHNQERAVPVYPPPVLYRDTSDTDRDRTCRPVVGSVTRPVVDMFVIVYSYRISCRGECPRSRNSGTNISRT